MIQYMHNLFIHSAVCLMKDSEPLIHYKLQFITTVLKQGSDSWIKCLMPYSGHQ